MNDSHKFPSQNDLKYEVWTLICKLINVRSEMKDRVSPSIFLEEMKLSTEERLEKLKNSTYKHKIMPIKKSQTFEPIPEIVVFQNFEPGVIYTTCFALRNNSKVPKPLRCIIPKSPYFTVTFASESVSTHIAPGISILFNIKFSADDLKDYKHTLTFATEEENISYPIYALRPRPLLNLPDEVNLPTTAIRITSEYCIFTRNFSKVPANFITHTKPPFSVSVEKGILMQNDMMKLTIQFNPTSTGTFKEYLTISYDSGETLWMKLQGRSEIANLNFEKGALHFHKTFIGLMRKRNVTLYNNSKYNVKFNWKMYATREEENDKLEKIKESLEMIKVNESFKSNKLENVSIIDHEGHCNVYNRILNDEVEEIASDKEFMYQNAHFEIVPMSGDILPNSRFEFTIFFTPTEVGAYHSDAFLEVTGRSCRLPMILNGSAVGPHIELNLESLDANKLYMCTVHRYEVIAINKGDIDGTISYPNQKLDFGGNLSCDPLTLHLKPSECGRFNLQFSSAQQGNFFEEVNFTIEESSDTLRFILLGEVICPYLSFDITNIDYGIVPIGFPARQKVMFVNSSMVPIDYKCFVYADGDVPSVTCKEYAYLPVKCGLPNRPREFDYSQRTGSVAANSSLSIELTLTANIIREVQTSLIVEMWKSERHTVSLPIKYKAISPHLVCTPAEINIKFCYIGYPYYRNITLHNDSNLPGYLELNLAESSQMNGISCSVSKSDIFVKPNEDVEVHLVISTSYMGEDRIPLFISPLAGLAYQCCSITCKGQGPILSVNPEELNFGKIPLLRDVSLDITVVNDSPIQAPVTITIPSRSFFKIDPMEFLLELEESMTIKVSICLYDPIKVSDVLTISAEQGNEVVCSLLAKGVGSSIHCEPNIEPELNLGLLLTYQEFEFPVKFCNMGTREHKMLWSRNKNLKVLLDHGISSIFTFNPPQLEVSPNDDKTTIIKCYRTETGSVNEDYYCIAQMGRSSRLEIILQCNVLAKFVEPRLKISKSEMKFFQNFSSDVLTEFTRDEVIITNVSEIEIDIIVLAEPPFYVENENKEMNLYLSMKHLESRTIFVKFCPDKQNNRCHVEEGLLKFDYFRHPKTDSILLIGEVNYPTLEIHPNNITFPNLPPGTVTYYELFLKNVSPLKVIYSFEWQEDSFEIYPIEVPESTILNKKQIIFETNSVSDLESENEIDDIQVPTVIEKYFETQRDVIDFDSTELEDIDSTEQLLVIFFYHQAYTEKYQIYHYIQIIISLEPRICKENLVAFPQSNLEYFMEMKSILYGAVGELDQAFDNEDILHTLPKNVTQYHINKYILDMTPIYGILKPYECQTVAIPFLPKPNTTTVANAICFVVGGAEEIIHIEGKSCPLSYSIETVDVDFGRQIFCDIIEKTVSLKNTSESAFEFSTSAKEVSKFVPSTLILEAGCLTVTPQHSKLLPGETTNINIQYLPGISGEFKEMFTLKVGYLPKLEINVHGYGDFPQVYLGARTSFEKLPARIAYLAIANITPEYLRSSNNINLIMHQMRNMNRQDLSKNVCKQLRQEGWSVISYRDLCPSIMDIDLAIERIFLYHHIYDDPRVLTKHLKIHKGTSVPDFIVPEYEINFDNVIKGQIASKEINVFNYGPISTLVRVVFPIKKKPPLGLDVNCFRWTRINVGQATPLCVNFHPTCEDYKKNGDTNISYVVFLDVAHGARIPIVITANVTVPTLEASVTNLDFGELRCGNVLKRTLILHNNGFVESTWSAVIEKRRRKIKHRIDVDRVLSRPVFYLNAYSGSLRPGAKYGLEVYYEPQCNGLIEWDLVIKIDHNPKQVKIILSGIGELPEIKINDEIIVFEPVLPYQPLCQQTFTIKNTCPVSLEFYLADYDLVIDEEEKVMNLIYEFYDSDSVLLPPKLPGQGLPFQLTNFYYSVIEHFSKKVIQISLNSSDNKNTPTEESIKSGTRKGSSKNKRVSRHSLHVNPMDYTDLLLPKYNVELDDLLKEHIHEMSESEKVQFDPISEAINEYKMLHETQEPPPLNEGVYVIFHGCFLTNFTRAANRTGLELNLPVYNIDTIIMESITSTHRSSAADQILEMIEKNYIASENSEQPISDFDSIEILENKIKHILNSSVQDLNKSAPHSIHRGPKEHKKEKEQLEKSTFLGIHEDLFQDVIKTKLSTLKMGVVIESLNSTFLLEPVVSLQIILKALGNARYIHCIIFSFSYEEYLIFNQKNDVEEEQKILREKDEKLQQMIDMELEELITVSPEDYQLLRRLLELNLKTVGAKEKKGKKQNVSKSKPVIEVKRKSELGVKKVTNVSPVHYGNPEIIRKFENFEKQLKEVQYTLEYWDRKLGVCAKPIRLHTSLKPHSKQTPKTAKTSVTGSVRDSPKHSSIQAPIDFSSISPEEEVGIIQRGVPCWIVQNAHPHKPLEELIAFYLRHTPDFQMALLTVQEQLQQRVEETIEMRTIKYAGRERIKNISEEFIITPYVNDSTSIELSKIDVLTKKSNKKRQNRSKAGSMDSRESKLQDHLETEKEKLKTRMVLQPDEEINYTVVFRPRSIGAYEHTFTIQLSDWLSKFYITCQGRCDLPMLSLLPKAIFPKVMKRRSEKMLCHKNIFFIDSNFFDFGPLLYVNKIDPKMLSSEAEFNFTNTSLIECLVTFCIRYNPEAFSFDKTEISITPGKTEILNICALPVFSNDETNDELIISIKDNPVIFAINLRSETCKPTFSVTPSIIRFERVIVKTTIRKSVDLKNTSPVSLFWELRNLEQVTDSFRIHPTRGCMEPSAVQSMAIEFYSEEQKEISKLPLYVDIYDKNCKSRNLLRTEYIQLGAEAVEIKINCVSDIDLGEVVGQKANVYELEITTQTKYELEYLFTPITQKDDPDFKKMKSLRSCFELDNTGGYIHPNKTLKVRLKYMFKTPFKAKKVALYNVAFTDPLVKALVEHFPLTVTFQTAFTSYELCPPEEVNFGYQLVGTLNYQKITLTNHGQYQFEFSIVTRESGTGTSQPNSVKESVRSGKKTYEKESKKSSKGGDTSARAQKLNFSCFSITPTGGVVSPHASVDIEVAAKPDNTRIFEESLVFIVSQTEESDEHGREINFVVNSMLPIVNFDDVDRIFQEQRVVNSLNEMDAVSNVFFIKDERKLFFSRVIMNTEVTARIKFENIGPIPALLMLTANSPDSVFSVLPKQLPINPYSVEYATIRFVPKVIKITNGSLNVNYVGVEAFKPRNFLITLSGEGLVPEIALISPEPDNDLQGNAISFAPTFVNSITQQSIIFKNIGTVRCQVILEVRDCQVDAFSLIPHSKTRPFLKIFEEEANNTSHNNAVYLEPEQTAEFYVQFQPISAGTVNCVVRLHTVNNPYGIQTIYVTGEGYKEDVVIYNLETCSIKDKFANNISKTAYCINFGELYINKVAKKCFQISNVSLRDVYKFEFPLSTKINFVPAKGHLKPGACKDVIATFLSKEPAVSEKVLLECVTYKIRYVNPQIEQLSWDERQTIVVWEPIDTIYYAKNVGSSASASCISETLSNRSLCSTTKTVKEKNEPEIDIVPNTSRLILLFVSAKCDYASYCCTTEVITIEDTLVFEQNIQTFEVVNCSMIFIELDWSVTIDEVSRITIEEDNSIVEEKNTKLAKDFRKSRRCLHHLTEEEKFLPDDTCYLKKSSLFSSEGSLINRGDEPYVKGASLPFQISPSKVTIESRKSQIFTVTFAPKDIFNYKALLKGDIPNLKTTDKMLNITVQGKSLLPLYYFDIPESDYLKSRQSIEMYADLLNRNAEVVEFNTIGLDSNVVRSFNIFNPSRDSFMYTWKLAETLTNEVCLFHCHRPEGIIQKGKIGQAAFSFMPPHPGTFEALYVFSILKYNVSKLFLMVGFAREPKIHFSCSYLKIRPTVLSLQVSEYVLLQNEEDFEVDFKFQKESLFCDSHLQQISVEPRIGILLPHGEQQIKITFHPVKVGEVQFSIQCMVTRMKHSVSLKVGAVCYKIQPTVLYHSDQGTNVTLSAEKVNTIQLKSLVPLSPQETIFVISNIGLTGFYYMWTVKEDFISNKLELAFQDAEGFVPVSKETSTKMIMTPLTKVVIKKLVVKLQIRYGPTFIIHLSGATTTSTFTFSFTDYDFSTCLIQKRTTSYYKTILEFSNSDEAPITLECKHPMEDCLTINFKSKIIEPGTTEQIEIYFHPFKYENYSVKVTFYVNSRPQIIRIKGSGVPHHLRLENANEKFLNFGSVPVGKKYSIPVTVINEGLASIDIIFNFPNRLPIYTKSNCEIASNEYDTIDSKSSKSLKSAANTTRRAELELEDDSINTGKVKTATISRKRESIESEMSNENLMQKSITFSPKRFTRVGPQKTTQFVITFSPTERINPFSTKIAYQVQDIVETICTLKGCSIGPDYVLDKEKIPFGSVILGYSNKQKILLNNIGDLGGTFKWTFEKNQHNITIAPDKGYITARSTTIFTIEFKPTSCKNLFKEKLKCHISNFSKPLELFVTGSCVDMPQALKTINFECPVRESLAKNIPVENRSSQTCKVTTTVQGQYFSSKEIYTFPPRATINCEVLYNPLTMTQDTPHHATIFYGFPEGQGVLYDLIGNTTSPLVFDKLIRQISCKTIHDEVLEVRNWLKNPQTFHVITENFMSKKILYKITSNPTIEVLGQSSRNYTWSIYVLNEGILDLRVVFQNKETGEYLHYEITLTIEKCQSLEEITLTTNVRQPVVYSLLLENPLKKPVTYILKSSSTELIHVKSQIVQPSCQEKCLITYKPLNIGETEAHIDFVSTDLGTYPYDFKLVAKPPIPEMQINFVAKLGEVVDQYAKITNTTKSTATFEATVTHNLLKLMIRLIYFQFAHPSLFYLSKNLTVRSEATKEFLISFDPNEIGLINSTLILCSPNTGCYIYTLKGECEVPKPLGPFFILPGNSVAITFRNPFNESKEFRISVEPAIFSISNSDKQTVKSKAELKILVSLLPLKNLTILIDHKYAITGRLSIQPTHPSFSHIKWVYYLQGDLNT
ncbi:hypothetical protein FQA39_LY03795 [Lamprigera yunnana]|nr:hypothetical protein FQA39_LY03795 [Lamprigera yunnana]